MCGICGIAGPATGAVTESMLTTMSAQIAHRGPNDAGVSIFNSTNTAVGLAHRRLSIVDLSSAGHQPMSNEDGTIWLVYNGEIYNHADLRVELIRLGHTYRSHTDSETIIHAYEEWGIDCVERFRGMFAFALWDSRRDELVLVRDRLGVKPLYYSRGPDGSLVFGSEIKAVLASGQRQAALNEGALSEYLVFGFVAGGQTLFDDVVSLSPAHWLKWTRQGVEIGRYWDVDFRPDATMTAQDASRRFRDLFEESIRLRLMSDVPLGVFLSGGLDSSAIAAITARMLDGTLNTFSVGFEQQYYSELPYARVVAEHIGAHHHEVILTPDDFISALPRMIWHEDEPLWAAPSVALYHVARHASSTATVVLTGEGSDELFAGYDRYWVSLWNERLGKAHRHLPASARRLLRQAISAVPAAGMRRRLGHSVLAFDSSPDGLIFDNWFGIFTPAMQRRIAGPVLHRVLDKCDAYVAHRALWAHTSSSNVVDQMLNYDLRASLVELLMKQDQMSMAASIESRVPFLDHKLVEFAATVPWQLKIRGGSGKQLLKTALHDCLPPEILHRKKMGFPVPFDAWLRERFARHVRGLLTGRRAVERDWFNPSAVMALLDEHRSGKQTATRQIWNLLTLELWARIFLDRDDSWLSDPSEAWEEAARAGDASS